MENCSAIFILDSNLNSREILKSLLEELDIEFSIHNFNIKPGKCVDSVYQIAIEIQCAKI